MANYEHVEMDLDSDNSHSSKGSAGAPTRRDVSPSAAPGRDVTRKRSSPPPRRHRSPPRRGDRDSRCHVSAYSSNRRHMRSPDRYRGDRRRDHRYHHDSASRRHRHTDRRSHRSRERHDRHSRRRSRSQERHRHHSRSSSSPSPPSTATPVVTSECSRVPPETTSSMSVSAVSCPSSTLIAPAPCPVTVSSSSHPDVSRVVERVERLRRQGCLTAYQQIVGNMQGSLNTLVTQALAQHPQAANIPKFYNPAAINITKIAEQERKKKLLWGNKSKPTGDDKTSTAWKPVAAFESDEDGKVAAKFLRLMGSKDASANGSAVSGSSEKLSETVKQHQRMFDDMEQQYEQARMSTHTQRGFGLGYTTQYYQPKF